LFEIWHGRVVIYGQENSGNNPGHCIAIEAGPGDRVIMPPGWAHFVANADANSLLIFGAWCDRQYGFDYTQMRAHHGLAWLPVLGGEGEISWEANPNYAPSQLQKKKPRTYPEFGLSSGVPIYELFRRNPESVQWVSDPAKLSKLWERFEP
jgi:glucose-6-phosphate isomerase